MANGLMDRVRHFLGLASSEPSMTSEQEAVAHRQQVIAQRLTARQKAIDVQVDVLRADRADARRGRE